MRYYNIEFRPDPAQEDQYEPIPGYMVTDDDGVFVKLTDASGVELTDQTAPRGYYVTLDLVPAEQVPAWGE